MCAGATHNAQMFAKMAATQVKWRKALVINCDLWPSVSRGTWHLIDGLQGVCKSKIKERRSVSLAPAPRLCCINAASCAIKFQFTPIYNVPHSANNGRFCGLNIIFQLFSWSGVRERRWRRGNPNTLEIQHRTKLILNYAWPKSEAKWSGMTLGILKFSPANINPV